MKEEEFKVQDGLTEEQETVNEPKEDEYLNLECLRLAFEIEKAKKVKKSLYVPVGGLTKQKAEDYITSIKNRLKDSGIDLYFPTNSEKLELVTFNDAINHQELIQIAHDLKRFLKG